MRHNRKLRRRCCGALYLLALFGVNSSAQVASLIDDTREVATFESLIQAGKFSDVQLSLEKYVTARPQSWRAQYQLGYVYFRLHYLQKSLRSICASLVLNANFAESHKVLAYDLNMLGHPERAIPELQLALVLDPSSAESHYELGRILFEKGSYVPAINHLEEAKALAPNSVRVYHNLGLAYSAISDQRKAVQNFEEALRRNRRQAKPSAWPLIDYATYLNQQEQFERARTLLLDSLSVENRWDQAFDELSKAYRGLGQGEQAIAALNRAIALNERKPEYHYVLAQLYKKAHQQDEARRQLALYETVRRPSEPTP